ncbi:hypothetical protein HY484_04535 [Candidatus Woesearchaeota archaeon]|nr:hypothetical protein [Candidatus Woesearchaeota archaeon]
MNITLIVASFAGLIALTHLIKQSAQRFTIPATLLAIITGLVLNSIYRIIPALQMPADFFSTLVLIIFVLLVFESTSRLKLSATDTTATHSIAFITLFASIVFVALALIAAPFTDITPVSSVVFAAAILGISAELLPKIKTNAHSGALIRLEAFWTTPISLITPLIITIFIPPISMVFISDIVNFFLSTTIKIIASIATGIFTGVLFAKLLTHTKSPIVPPLIIATAFVSFALGTIFGLGILAVASFGAFFTNAFATTHKPFIQLNHKLTSYAGILAVILFGSIIRTQYNAKFFLFSAILFASYIAIRYIAIKISHKKHAFSETENKLMTFYAPSSEAPCAVLLFLATFPPTSIPLSELSWLLSTGLMFIIYSNILAFVILQAPNLLKKKK